MYDRNRTLQHLDQSKPGFSLPRALYRDEDVLWSINLSAFRSPAIQSRLYAIEETQCLRKYADWLWPG